jgi:hypothetical protein
METMEGMRIKLLVFALMFVCGAALWAQQRDEAAARELFADANRERAQRNIPVLKWNPRLAEAAAAHTEAMAQKGTLAHVLPGEPELGKRLAAADARVGAYAENVAFASDAASVHDGWMHSPGHRANLLNPTYDAVGIAAYRVGDRLYATQDFGVATSFASADDADLRIREAIATERQRARLAPLRTLVPSGKHADNCSAGQIGSGGVLPGHRRSNVSYTATDPAALPEVLKQRVDDARYTSYAISVCQQQQGGFTMMAVETAFFD